MENLQYLTEKEKRIADFKKLQRESRKLRTESRLRKIEEEREEFIAQNKYNRKEAMDILLDIFETVGGYTIDDGNMPEESVKRLRNEFLETAKKLERLIPDILEARNHKIQTTLKRFSGAK